METKKIYMSSVNPNSETLGSIPKEEIIIIFPKHTFLKYSPISV
jgi:hypothetical protein